MTGSGHLMVSLPYYRTAKHKPRPGKVEGGRKRPDACGVEECVTRGGIAAQALKGDKRYQNRWVA
jgi:hypothetical protein